MDLPRPDDQGFVSIDSERWGLDGDERYRVRLPDTFTAIQMLEDFVRDFGPEALEILYRLRTPDPDESTEAAFIGGLYRAVEKLRGSLDLGKRCRAWLAHTVREGDGGDDKGGFVLKANFDRYYAGRPLHVMTLAFASFYMGAGDFFPGLSGRLMGGAGSKIEK